MRKLLAVFLVLIMASLTMTGCSEHESEISKQQQALEEDMDRYMAEQDAKGAAEKVPDADAPEVVVVSVYRLADGTKGLVMEMEDVPELDDWELTQKLKAYGILPETAQVVDYRPEDGILEYAGVDTLTPREAQAIINTFTENMEIPGQVTLLINGKEVLTSGFNADLENIDDTYTGGADDGAAAQSGPGVS